MKRRTRIMVCLALLCAVCTGFTLLAQDIELPRTVPSFNQAYTEGTDAWGNCQLGTVGCPDEVCTTGCLVTAFASVLAYYDVVLSVSASASCSGQARSGMDPGIFNDWLRETGGYGQCAQDPVGNCCLIWGQLPGELEITTHVNRSDVGLNPVSAVVIDHALRQGKLVVAGVHWGAFCNGGSTQSEDCHWVILTGKRDGVYTIIDPFNPDPSSPYGVRTTLDAGVHGSYIIDRFVVVAGSSASDIQVRVGLNQQGNASYHIGDRVVLTLATPGTTSALVPYARVTKPSGQILYATWVEGEALQFVVSRHSLTAAPRQLTSSWTWFDRIATSSDVGRWTWEIWVEHENEPGTKLGRQTIAYEVAPTGSVASPGSAILGILLVAVLAAIAFVSVMGADLE